MDFRIELVEDRADQRRADRFELFFDAAYLVAVGAFGIDHQEHSIDDAGKQQRIVRGQYRRRVEKHEAKPLRDRLKYRSRSRPIDAGQKFRRFPAGTHDTEDARPARSVEQLDWINRVSGLRTTFQNLAEPDAVEDARSRRQ